MLAKNGLLIFTLLCTLTAHAGPLSKEERGRFQTRIAAVSNRFTNLTEEQLNLFAEILGGIGVNRDLIAFTSGYGGGREGLTEHLRQLRDWRNSVQSGRGADVLKDWFKLPGLAEAERLHRELTARGWTLSLTNEDMRRAGKPIDGLVSGKSITVRVGLTDEPPALILFEELLHATDLRIYEMRKEVVRQWLRLVIAENKTPGVDPVSQAERYHWGYLRGLEAFAKTAVNEAEIDEALQFILEQSAYQRKLAAYKALVKSDARYRQEMWEEIASSSVPFETINLVLTQTRFRDLPPGLTARIGVGNLSEIAGISGEASLPGLGLSSLRQPEMPWTTLDSFATIVPPTLRDLDVERFDIYSETSVRRMADSLSAEEIEALARYLVEPHLVTLPYKAEEVLRKRFGESGRRLTNIHRQYLFITAMIVQYDVQHGTHYTESAGFAMVSNLHRDVGMRDYDELVGRVARRFRYPNATPEMAVGLLESLMRSRAAGGYLHDPNGLRGLREILELAGKRLPYETLDTILMSRYQHFVGAGRRNREGSSFLDWSLGQDTVRAGLEIMTSLGHELGIRKYEALLQEADQRLKQASHRSAVERGAREATPAGYDKAKLPAPAAALIVAAQRRQEALQQADPASFDRKFVGVAGFFKYCADQLRLKKP